MSDPVPPSEFDRLWDYGDPAATETRLREAVRNWPADTAADLRLQLDTQIARTQGLRGDFDEARALLDRVAKELTDDTPVARVRWLLEGGRVLNSSRSGDHGYALFREAWDQACAAGLDFHAVDAAHMLNIVAPEEEKLSWGEQAMEWAEQATDPRAKGWLGALYNNMGWTYHGLGRFEEALATHRKGLAWFTERERPVQRRIAKWAVARMLRSLERCEEALAIQHEVIDEWAEAGHPERAGFAHEEVAENLVALDREPEARPHWIRARALLESETWVRESEPDRWERLVRCAEQAAASAGPDPVAD